MNFHNSGLAKQHYNSENFWVLTIANSARRLEQLLAATEEVAEGDNDAQYFWFTVEDHVDIWHPERLLGPIWWVAAEPE